MVDRKALKLNEKQNKQAAALMIERHKIIDLCKAQRDFVSWQNT
jgi:hypothetical protein